MSDYILTTGKLPLNKKYFSSARNVSKHNINERNIKTGSLPQNRNFFISEHIRQGETKKNISTITKSITENSGQRLRQTISSFLRKMLENFAENVENIGKLYKMR